MMTINNIDDVIELFEADKINSKQVLEIISNQPTAIMVWSSDADCNYSKETTLESLRNYKKYLEAGCEFPIFWPFLSDDPTKFSLNNALKR